MTLLYMDWKTFLKSTTTATRSKFLKLCSFWTLLGTCICSAQVYVPKRQPTWFTCAFASSLLWILFSKSRCDLWLTRWIERTDDMVIFKVLLVSTFHSLHESQEIKYEPYFSNVIHELILLFGSPLWTKPNMAF